VTLYEEVGSASVEKIVDMATTLDEGLDELMDGDIIVYHKTSDLVSTHGNNNHHHQRLFSQQQQAVPSGVIAPKVKSLQEFYTHMQYRSVTLATHLIGDKLKC